MIFDTIVAPATAPGVSAIAVIRLSGPESLSICNQVFKGKDLTQVDANTIHFGTINDGDQLIDEVLVSVFKAPHSFTKEDSIEISTHGSMYIVEKVIQLLIRKGARSAEPGEFTRRAFLNGQFDLAQAEAVADLIHSDSEAAHQAAIHQMRGGFSEEIKALRDQLIHFASLVELELDFGEEDVEFADRDDLKKLVNDLLQVIIRLASSFDMGNVIKEGIPIAIVGKPNAGKSTLLNSLLNEEKAIVTEIAGTTRDFIEDELIIEGVKFRFIDTAGLRDTEDMVESIGIARSREKMAEASLVLFIYDTREDSPAGIEEELSKLKKLEIPYLILGNKIDLVDDITTLPSRDDTMFISAQDKEKVDALRTRLIELVHLDGYKKGDTVVTNIRHYESLIRSRESLDKVLIGLGQNITGDFLAMDIRQSLHHLGLIVGEVTTDDLLESIFSRFCIGK